jgi:hypothetical protein
MEVPPMAIFTMKSLAKLGNRVYGLAFKTMNRLLEIEQQILEEGQEGREWTRQRLQDRLQKEAAKDRACRCAVGSKGWLERKGLKLNEKKTRIVDFEKESLEFLGFRLAWRKARSGRSYPHCEPAHIRGNLETEYTEI